MGKKLLQLIHLHKDYRCGSVTVPALRGITLDLAPGDFLAIMGPSGSGKSTLLNLLGCLDRPSSGRYVFDGVDVGCLHDEELSALRSSVIGFIFQSYNLITHLTVLENLEVPFYYQSDPPDDVRERCLDLAERVGLGDRLHHCPSELSGGQQQRLAIARALANDPPLLLADEPTGNLDTATSHDIMDLVAELNSAGKTIVMVTHEEDIAARARRVVKLRDGELVEDRMQAAPPPRPAGLVESRS